MNSHTNRRKLALIIWGIAMVAIILLAGNLSPLDLNSTKRLQPEFAPSTADDSVKGTWYNYTLIAFTVLSAIIILLALLSVIYLLFSPETRQEVLAQVFCLLLFCLLFSLVIRNQLYIPENWIATLPSLALPGGEVQRVTFNPNPSIYLVWAVNIGLALLVVWIFFRVAKSILSRRRRGALHQVAKEAQTALNELHAGIDLGSTVLDCYQKMVIALSRDRDITRPQDMTPREFVSYLVRSGLPESPIQQLTLLFEHVRYGAKIADTESDRKAVESLEAIVAFCRKSL
jgi:hypothetical protein